MAKKGSCTVRLPFLHIFKQVINNKNVKNVVPLQPENSEGKLITIYETESTSYDSGRLGHR